jgi:ketosteroid isomerase-like protein
MKVNLLCAVFVMSAACATNSVQILEAENIKLVRSMFDAFNKHDWQSMAAYYSDSALFLDPSLGTTYVRQNHEQMEKKYKAMEDYFPNIHDSIAGIYPSGANVMVEFVSTGTAVDGTTFRLPISCVLTIENTQIVRDATYYNNCSN